MSPEAFERCRKNGGRIVTEKLGGRKYRHVCYLGGKKFNGHAKLKKKGK